MSDDTTKDALDDMKSAAELDPIVKGIEAIASDVVKSRKATDERLEKYEKTVERMREDLESKMNKGHEDILERLQRQGAAHSAAVRTALRIEPGEDDLREVIPKHYKENANSFEVAADCVGKAAPKLRTPVAYMAANRWFELAAKQGLSKWSAQQTKIAEERAVIEQAFNAVQKAAMQEDTDAEGGNLVPTLVAAEINRLIMDASDLWPRCRQVALQTKITNFPTENTAVTVNWINEEGALTQGEPTFSQVAIEAEKLAGRAKFSIELLQDSAPMLLQYLLTVFTEKMAGELDYQLVLGDGTSPELLGIVNDGNITTQSLSGTTTKVKWSNLVNLFVGAGEKWARSNGVWVCSPKGYAAMIGLSDSNSSPVIQWGASTQDTPAGSVLGRPIVVSNRFGGTDTLDNTTDSTTKICFGPPMAIVAGTRQGMAWDVTDAVGWANYQMDARLVGRFGARPVVGSAWTTLENIDYD